MEQTKAKRAAAKTTTPATAKAKQGSLLREALVDRALKKRWDDALSRYRKAGRIGAVVYCGNDAGR